MRNVTPIPNTLFDKYLCQLKPTETIVLLTIFRQTNGWVDQYGKRKSRDWITHSQFMKKTGLSDKTVTKAIDGLIEKRLIKATDIQGNLLMRPEERRGKPRIFYGPYYKSTVKNA
jgi:hypothetical protein